MARGLIILFFCHFTVDMFTGIWPLYKSLAKIDLYEAGLIAMIGGILGNFSQLLFGVLADKGYRKILLLGGLIFSSMASLYTLANANFSYFILLILTFVGSSMFHPSATGMVGSLTTHKKGFLISLFVAGGGLGLAVGQKIYHFAYITFDHKTYFLLVFPLIAIMLFFLLPSQVFISKDNAIQKDSQKSFSLIFGVFKKLKGLYFIMVLNAAIHIGMTFLIPELMRQLNMGKAMETGVGHLCFVMGGVAAIIIAGFFADRFGHKNMIIASMLIALPLWYIFLNGDIDIFALKLFLFICLGGMLSICNPIGVALGQHLLPKQSSLVSALLMGCAWAMGTIGVLLTSYLAGKFDPVFALNILGIFIVINIGLALLLPSFKKSGTLE